MNTYLAIIQTITVVIAASGLLVALNIAASDRREAARIATEDRAEARHEAERRHTLDLLVRLSINLEHGGSTDPHETKRLGAEATALTYALGPDRFPAWEVEGNSLDDARAWNTQQAKPNWRTRANDVLFELDRVANDPSVT